MTFGVEIHIALKCVVCSYCFSIIHYFYILALIIIASLCVDLFLFFCTFPFSVLQSIAYIYLHYFIVSFYLFIYKWIRLFTYLGYTELKTTGMN
jgi:hypothetical protein